MCQVGRVSPSVHQTRKVPLRLLITVHATLHFTGRPTADYSMSANCIRRSLALALSHTHTPTQRHKVIPVQLTNRGHKSPNQFCCSEKAKNNIQSSFGLIENPQVVRTYEHRKGRTTFVTHIEIFFDSWDNVFISLFWYTTLLYSILTSRLNITSCIWYFSKYVTSRKVLEKQEIKKIKCNKQIFFSTNTYVSTQKLNTIGNSSELYFHSCTEVSPASRSYTQIFLFHFTSRCTKLEQKPMQPLYVDDEASTAARYTHVS